MEVTDDQGFGGLEGFLFVHFIFNIGEGIKYRVTSNQYTSSSSVDLLCNYPTAYLKEYSTGTA